MKLNKKLLKENAGNLVRVGSATGVVGSALNWYNGVKDYALNEVIDNLGKGLTDSIDKAFALYGIGEGINTYNQFKADKEKKERPNLLEYTGRFARMAPIAAPFISLATDGDFFKSVILPAAVCIGGYGTEYVGRLFKRNNVHDRVQPADSFEQGSVSGDFRIRQ
jgi:hypothetical protein